MLQTIMRAIVVGIVCLVIFYLVQFVVAAVGLPSVVTLLVGVLLILIFIVWLIKAFGIDF